MEELTKEWKGFENFPYCENNSWKHKHVGVKHLWLFGNNIPLDMNQYPIAMFVPLTWFMLQKIQQQNQHDH